MAGQKIIFGLYSHMTSLSSRQFNALFFSILLLLTPSIATSGSFSDLPDLGAASDSIMTPAEEARLGKAFMRSIRRNNEVINTPIVVEYIENLGHQIANEARQKGQAFQFFVINKASINAFAGPGGHIGVNSGLITATENEGELAAVLAHEIAHVTQDHLRRAWQNAQDMALPNAALLIAAIVLGATMDNDASMGPAAAAQAGMLQQQINFTRTHEQEADRIGMDYLVANGYAPHHMPNFFRRLGRMTNSYLDDVPEMLFTHPVTNSRIADSLGRADEIASTETAQNTLTYSLVKTQLNANASDDPADAVARFSRELEDQNAATPDASRFGLALSLMRLGKYQQAHTLLSALNKGHPNEPAITINLAKSEHQLGNSPKARERLQKALTRSPQSYALLVEYLEILMADRAYQEAQKTFNDYASVVSHHPQLFKLAAQIAGENNQKSQSHRYLSEYHYDRGELSEAILQLELALKTPDLNFYESSKIEALLASIKKEKAALDKEE